MNSFYELAARRQSCRSFKDKAVDAELLKKCVETAALAPSACNSQPWHFTVVTKEDTRRALSKLVQEIGLNSWSEQAPAFVVVSENAELQLMPAVREHYDEKRFAEGDVGMATAYFVLAAAEHGLGCCIIGTFTDSEVKNLVGLPEGDTVRVVIAVGYAADETVRAKKRKGIDEICRFID